MSATGHFNQPVTPTFDGQDSFAGQIVHTAKWPTDLDLSGKKVAVIGTGASSMQLVPTIANDLAALTIFQRTPQWARNVPEYHLAVDEHASWLFRYLPMYSQWYRFAQLWRYGDGLLRFLKVDPEWEHPDRSLNRINERHRNEIVSYITEKLEGRPDLLDKCIPSYPPFGKRILIDNGWFDTLCQQHVTLVTDPIDQFCETGVQTNEGEVFEADVIILATGFDVTTLASRIDITGKTASPLPTTGPMKTRGHCSASTCRTSPTCSSCTDRIPTWVTAEAECGSQKRKATTSPNGSATWLRTTWPPLNALANSATSTPIASTNCMLISSGPTRGLPPITAPPLER